VQAIGLMEGDGFVIEFKAEAIDKLRKDPSQLQMARDMPVERSKSQAAEKRKVVEDAKEEAKEAKHKGILKKAKRE